MTTNAHWAITIVSNRLNAGTQRVHSDVKNQELPPPPQPQRQQQQPLRLNVRIFIRNIIHRRQHTLNRTAIDTLRGPIQLPILDTLNTINGTDHVT